MKFKWILRTVLLVGAAALGAWQFWVHSVQSREIPQLQKQAAALRDKVTAQKPILQQLEARQQEMMQDREAREKARELTLSLARERAAATAAKLAVKEAEERQKQRAQRSTFANSLTDPENLAAERVLRRNELHASLNPPVKKLNLTSEEASQLTDHMLEMEFTGRDRFVALLRDQMQVGEALVQR